jgi:hypothetical protein
MMNLEHQEALVREVRDGWASSQGKVTVDLTVDMVMGQDDLLDRVFDFTFDVLGLRHVELRIREGPLGRCEKEPALIKAACRSAPRTAASVQGRSARRSGATACAESTPRG